MKRFFILSLLLAVGLMAFAQQAAPQWHRVLSDTPESYRIQLISSSEQSIQVNVQVPGFYTASVTTPRGEAQVITMPKAVSTAKAGEPDMPMTGIPVLIGDQARMSIRVIDAQYRDIEGIEVAPSKGDFPRTINPEDVPYTYGECYSQDAFFPANNIGLYEPYIVRDFRGQNMVLYPFAYNPATRTLRVYYNMTVEMYKVDDHGSNTIESRRSNVVKMDPDFKSVYQRHFINYEAAMNRYTPLDEEGDLLIICYDNFINSMADFVNWKKTRGVNTTIVGTSTAGSTSSAIKSYIQSQYNANNNLTHVLLVGDVAQIPGYTYSGGGSNWAGKGDNPYGQIVGNDIYNDVIIGRFSAGSVSQVTTQVNRIINYERNLTTSDTWCQNGLGISASAGNGGHYNEDDYQHIENLRTDLLNYGYSTVYQDYKSVNGYPNSTTTTISNHINSGVGIINYCNHGEETGWQSHYYMNSNVNALTNNNKLPFIFSVACLVGKYDYASGDCFAETWMHATNGSTPTGAISGMFSYISQPWIPPMWAQDEFVDILCELKNNNIKRTFGGAAMNGLFSIFDNYNTSSTEAVGCYQAWVLYGDPTLVMRTKTPQAMTVIHTGTIAPSATTYSVTVSNGSGAVATITDADHNILGKATVSGTTANISINGTLTANQELTLCVFGYNKVTYLGTITVNGGTPYTITATASPSNGGTVSGAGTYYGDTPCTLTATANTHYEFTKWTKNGTQVSTDNPYTFTVTSDATLVAHFTALQQHTVTCNTTQNGSISANPTSAYKGDIVTLTATPATGYCLGSWTVIDASNNSITVSSDNTFTMPDSNVTVSATFVVGYNVTLVPATNGTISANPTSGPAGTTITLTATPATGYVFNSWVVYETGDVTSTVTVTNNTFVLPAHDVTVVGIFTAPQGGDVTIGSGTTSGYYLPTGDYYKYSLTQQIYTASELGTAGTITAISFYYNTSTSSNPRSLQVYMSHTSSSTITAWSTVNSSQLVYTGTHTFNQGWNTITLTTPFAYNGTSNVLLTVDDNTGAWTTNSQFYTYSTGAKRAIYYRNDSTNPDPTGTVSVTANSLQVNAQMMVTKEVPSTEGFLYVSPTSLSGFQSMGGVSPSESQSVAFIGANLQSNVNVTLPAGFEASTTATGTYASTLTLTPSNGELRTMVYVRISANANPGSITGNMTFTCGSSTATVSLSGTVIAGSGIQYTITAVASPANAGTISGAGTYYETGTCTLTATANTGYIFTEWQLEGATVSTEAQYSFTVTDNATYTAVFTEVPTYDITVVQPQHGTVSTDKTVAEAGETVTLTTTPASGYMLYHAYVYKTGDPNTFVELNGSSFVMPEYAVTVTATFIEDAADNFVKVTAAPSDWSGEYLIVYESGPYAFNGGLSTLDAAGNYISVTISDDKIAVTDATDAARFTIAAYDGGYSILSASGTYIGRTNTSNGMTTNTSALKNTISYSNNSVSITGTGGPALQFYNQGSNSRFRYYSTTQKAIQLYKKTENVSNIPTHTIHFVDNGGSGSMADQSVTEYVATALNACDFTREGYTFVGWNTQADGSGQSYADGASVTLINDLTLYAQWIVGELRVSYRLVTSADQLVAGETYLIVNRSYSKALSVTQNSNNRAAATVEITDDAITNLGDACELTLGYEGGKWTFFDALYNGTGGYLYAASSSSNQLKTQTTLNDNGKWSITIADGAATIKAQGSNSRNWLRYNNSNTLFSCYASGQEDVSLFVRVEEIIREETVTLEAGWNWWTPTVSVSMEALQTAMGDNEVIVHSNDGGTVETLVPGQMYKLEATGSFSFTVMGVYPISVDVDIQPGYNWFGYTGDQPTTIAEALGSDFAANPGDMINSQGAGFAIYEGGAWHGTLTQLQPGRGYLYFSTASNTRTLRF